MAKTAATISTKLPRFNSDKPAWRRAILAAVMEESRRLGVKYDGKNAPPMEVAVLIYLQQGKGLDTRDVDNLVQHVLDALQGRFGSTRAADCLIENDNCIARVVVEKRVRPKHLDDTYGGKLLIRPYRKGNWPS